jgi:hypothetical protein
MTNLLLPVLLAVSTSACFIEGYCNDKVAGAPACEVGDGGGADTETASATLLPFALGEHGVATRWIATGGSAQVGISMRYVSSANVHRGDDALARLPDSSWLVTDAADDDALRVTGTDATTGRPFVAALPLRVATVDTVVLAPSAAYTRLYDGAPAFFARAGDRAPTPFVQLRSLAGDRLIDISMALDAETSSTSITQDAWDHLELPTAAGTYRVGLLADSFGSRDIAVTVVDHLDHLELSRPATRPSTNTVCFHAVTGAREVFADWTITVDGVEIPTSGANCAIASGTIVASAGGLALTVDAATP